MQSSFARLKPARPARLRITTVASGNLPRSSLPSSKQGDVGPSLSNAAPALLAAVTLCLQPLDAAALAAPYLTPEEQRTITIFKEATPSVVSVKNLAVRRDVFTPNMLEIPQGGGSGLIWDKQGHVVTNYHVISDASDIQVTLDGGIDMKAKVIGVDTDRDIAVLQLLPPKPAPPLGMMPQEDGPPSPDTPPAPTPVPESSPPKAQPQQNPSTRDKRFRDADSKVVPMTSAILTADQPQVNFKDLIPMDRCSTSTKLLVGQRVYAIGNPFGLDHTLTTGVVSGTGREIQSVSGRPIQDVIQTDAAINPGNSGGPLLDSGGCLIGINTAIYSPSGANSGVGFAIPVDTVTNSVQQIIQTGRVVKPILGIAFAPEQSSDQLGVKGILVLSAKENGPAAKAGVKGTTRDEFGRLVLGDIIIGINGQTIKTSSDLYRILDKCQVGDQIKLEVLRGNEKEVVTVVLESSESA